MYYKHLKNPQIGILRGGNGNLGIKQLKLRINPSH